MVQQPPGISDPGQASRAGFTTFQDDPNRKTYCLEDTLSGNG